MFFEKKKSIEMEVPVVSTETKMCLELVVAIARKSGIKPKDLAKTMAEPGNKKYFAEFTIAFAEIVMGDIINDIKNKRNK